MKPNFQFEKRRRDLAKKQKQEEKRQRKLAEKGARGDAPASPEGAPDTPDVPPSSTNPS